MDIKNATEAFTALSQETRLKVFKILVEYGHTGTAAGTISKTLNMPHNSLSFHLTHLSQAGLITSQKKGRSIIYTANIQSIENLIHYLKENCCSKQNNAEGKCL
tara:strand:+ start:137177 stop:137488 length:312 start_codon:yes stop_codon:yes gene_type:complete